MTVLRDRVGELRPGYQVPEAFGRSEYKPGELAQWDLWFPDYDIPVGHGQTARLPVLVWLPQQYDELRNRLTKFPTVMVLPGQPSTPQATFNGFAFAAQATRAIDSGKVRPFIAVFPPLMIAPPRDTECTDVPGGPQAETWLSSSVRQQVVKRFRSDPSGAKWSSGGWFGVGWDDGPSESVTTGGEPVSDAAASAAAVG